MLLDGLDPSTPSRELLNHQIMNPLISLSPNPFMNPRQRVYSLLMPTVRRASNGLAVMLLVSLLRVIQFLNTVGGL